MTSHSVKKRFERLDPALKDRILNAAVGEFCRYGYTSASMNRVVQEADISKGALFKYFGTKAALFDHIYRTVLEKVKEPLKEARDKTVDLPFYTRLDKVIRAGLDMADRFPFYTAIYYRVIYTGDAPHSRKILASIQEEGVRFWRALIEEGITRGDLREDVDPGRSAFILQSVLDRFLQARYLEKLSSGDKRRGPISTDMDDWIDEILTVFNEGMGKKQEVQVK